MKRLACIAALLLVWSLGTAQAQVATTDLVPAAPNYLNHNLFGFNSASLTPENPAALAWGNPSRVAAGYIKGNHDVPPSAKFSGEYAGARLVGKTFGLGLETSKVKDDSSNNDGTLDQSSNVQLSLNLGSVALGLGSGKIKNNPDNVDAKRTEAGASLRLNEVWYFGLGAYQDKDTPSGTNTTYKRNGTVAGVALRTQGQWHWYLAYDYIKLNNFSISGTDTGGFNTNRFTVQLAAGNWVLGAASAKEADKSAGATHDWKTTTLDFGYAPMKGVAVSARSQTTKATGSSTEKITTNSLSVAYLF